MAIPASYWCLYMTQGIHNIADETKAVRMAEQFPDVVVFQAELIEPIDPQFVIKLTDDVKSLEARLRESLKKNQSRPMVMPPILMPYPYKHKAKPKPWWRRKPSWL